MGQREPLSKAEKERIYQGMLKGQSVGESAQGVGCSQACVLKWRRIGRKRGLEGMRARRLGRGKKGVLSQFEAEVREQAKELKVKHPGWGADRVLVELGKDSGVPRRLPSRSRLAAYFKQCCPEAVARRNPRPPAKAKPLKASSVHQIWEVDSQEKIVLANGEIATICNIRDPFGAAMIASQAFSVKTEKHWRKLKWTEVRQVLRRAFFEWNTLPDDILTDNELCLAGTSHDPFPGKLTLWLVGLGIGHQFIRPHRPTDQPEIERSHRTMDGFALHPEALADLSSLQASLDYERVMYNHFFPTQASDCQRHPPLQAHPELLTSRRYYHPDAEVYLFDIQRVYDYLASFPPFRRKVLTSGQISLGKRMYCIGMKLIKKRNLQFVLASFDPHLAEWVVSTDEPQPVELLRFPIKGMDFFSLTGLNTPNEAFSTTFQLSLPFVFQTT